MSVPSRSRSQFTNDGRLWAPDRESFFTPVRRRKQENMSQGTGYPHMDISGRPAGKMNVACWSEDEGRLRHQTVRDILLVEGDSGGRVT